MTTALQYENETYQIIGSCMTVHKSLGCGFLESVYQEAIEKTFTKNKLPYKRQQKMKILFEGVELTKYFIADFVCFDKVILEIKACEYITKNHQSQLLNYLKSTKMEIGLLVNFGESSLKWKRLINTPNLPKSV